MLLRVNVKANSHVNPRQLPREALSGRGNPSLHSAFRRTGQVNIAPRPRNSLRGVTSLGRPTPVMSETAGAVVVDPLHSACKGLTVQTRCQSVAASFYMGILIFPCFLDCFLDRFFAFFLVCFFGWLSCPSWAKAGGATRANVSIKAAPANKLLIFLFITALLKRRIG